MKLIKNLILKTCKSEFICLYYQSLINPNYILSPNTLTYLIYYYENR